MLLVHGKKIIFTLLMVFMLPPLLMAQMNYQNFANKQIYFGISLGANSSNFKVVHAKEFLYHDTVRVINSSRGPGFQLGIVSNLKMGKYFDARFVPTLNFSERSLNYTLIGDSSISRKIESIFLEFPVTLRFKSDPVGDVRIYVLAGLKYSMDLASNAKARRAQDQVKLSRNDVSLEYGIGVQFFFPLFIFSPEIKFSRGLFDIHARDQNLIFSNVLDKLFSRTFMISLNFEG